MRALQETLMNMRMSLASLDENQAPAAIGAYLDLAVCRLEQHLATLSSEDGRELPNQSRLPRTGAFSA